MVASLSHVGISVSNLDRSIAFYCAAFGLEVAGRGTFAAGTEDGRYEAILGLKGATGKSALLRAAGIQVELFEFESPVPKRSDPQRPVCDHGITHFCIEVDSIVDAVSQLKVAGATFHCPPLEFFGKAKATYARDPDGNVIELLELFVGRTQESGRQVTSMPKI